MIGVAQVFGHLALQDGRIYRRQQRFEHRGQIARRGGQGLVPLLVDLGARRILVGKQQLEFIDVVLAHSGEPVEPFGAVRCERCE